MCKQLLNLQSYNENEMNSFTSFFQGFYFIVFTPSIENQI